MHNYFRGEENATSVLKFHAYAPILIIRKAAISAMLDSVSIPPNCLISNRYISVWQWVMPVGLAEIALPLQTEGLG
ncbi:MAG: hypothetical protein KJ573_15660, partial [Proteobacteria bacterium]|nr:hypothetical protein [Pseudomonadota bacterium]